MKMHSGDTRSRKSRVANGFPAGMGIRRRLVSLLMVIVAAVTLTACAEGTARDAKQDKQQDAMRTSVVNDIQATESAGFLLNPATPSPEPTK